MLFSGSGGGLSPTEFTKPSSSGPPTRHVDHRRSVAQSIDGWWNPSMDGATERLWPIQFIDGLHRWIVRPSVATLSRKYQPTTQSPTTIKQTTDNQHPATYIHTTTNQQSVTKNQQPTSNQPTNQPTNQQTNQPTN